MLGAVLRLTELVSPESILKVIETRIPFEFLELNKRALELGMRLAGELND
jgi:2-oxoglutarate ferredoxin oxidoreductase subunit gamma